MSVSQLRIKEARGESTELVNVRRESEIFFATGPEKSKEREPLYRGLSCRESISARK